MNTCTSTRDLIGTGIANRHKIAAAFIAIDDAVYDLDSGPRLSDTIPALRTARYQAAAQVLAAYELTLDGHTPIHEVLFPTSATELDEAAAMESAEAQAVAYDAQVDEYLPEAQRKETLPYILRAAFEAVGDALRWRRLHPGEAI